MDHDYGKFAVLLLLLLNQYYYFVLAVLAILFYIVQVAEVSSPSDNTKTCDEHMKHIETLQEELSKCK